MQHLQPNTTLQGGKYRIGRMLGQGGFGITYLATQVSLQREVAVKEFFMKDFCSRDDATSTLLTTSTGSGNLVEQCRKKFFKEARNLARLSHPNIISVIDVFEENGTVYYVMPYLKGGSLQDYVGKHGALSETEAMKYIKQVAGALKYMHNEQHICHYDVKPANILLDEKGNAVLIDFGISKNYDSSGQETTSTPVGYSDGYAPIEQYHKNFEIFSPASDVYSLGATLYFLLHGKAPISAVDRAAGEYFRINDAISPSIKGLINASMTLSKQERAKDVEVFLKEVSAPSPQGHTPVFIDESWLIFIALLYVVISIGIGIYIRNKHQTNPRIIEEETVEDINEANEHILDPVIQNLIINMVHVEGGTFTMGTPPGQNTYDYSKPAHKVTLSSFSIGKYEVTQEEWEAVMGNNPSYFKGSKRPVENVSWNDCQAFIEKLNNMTGQHFRLPTEAEWEYAARGGNQNNDYKYAGSDNYNNVAWHMNNSEYFTHEVGQKVHNELGLYDMSGNVWEWCNDKFDYYSSSAQTNPKGPSSGDNNVIRGGSVFYFEGYCEVTYRGYLVPSTKLNELGFRLAL